MDLRSVSGHSPLLTNFTKQLCTLLFSVIHLSILGHNGNNAGLFFSRGYPQQWADVWKHG